MHAVIVSRYGLCLMLLGMVSPGHAGGFNPAYCDAIAGTLNFHWEGIAGGTLPCVGIEFTDGQLADAADGNFTMQGTSLSNPTCMTTAVYELVLSDDRNTLQVHDTVSDVPFTMTRAPRGRCFTGTWISGEYVFVATLSSAAAGDVFLSGFED